MVIDTKNCRSCGKLLKTNDVHILHLRKNPRPIPLCSKCNTAFRYADAYIDKMFEDPDK